MTVERSVFVRMPRAFRERILGLNSRAMAARQRSEKLPPGDRTEIARFRAIQAVIDQLAIMAVLAGEPSVIEPDSGNREGPGASVLGGATGVDESFAAPREVVEWLAAGELVIALRLPHFSGETVLEGSAGVGPPPPADRWTSSASHTRSATLERFEFLLSRALEDPEDVRSSLRPSDVSNTVLTETLRRHVLQGDRQPRVDLRVVYRDGSEGPRFPMRCIRMSETAPDGWRTLKFALMSIRHVEMDEAVDGAWLRNSKVSRPRAAGLTDAMVFETSLRQLRHLGDAPTEIQMFQTGLEPAIVGFYRAVVHRMIEKPRALAVVPQYFQGNGQFAPGTVWRAR